MTKYMNYLYEVDCLLFRIINGKGKKKWLNRFFATITHMGGAFFTISVSIVLILFSTNLWKVTAIASGMALAISSIPVFFVKNLFKRQRPYLVLDEIFVTDKPLKDHSFPSGHTTAIFSLIIPYICLNPFLIYFLLPIGLAVGISRIHLGLHYPSDVLVGALLGSVTGCFTYSLMMTKFIFYFL